MHAPHNVSIIRDQAAHLLTLTVTFLLVKSQILQLDFCILISELMCPKQQSLAQPQFWLCHVIVNNITESIVEVYVYYCIQVLLVYY